MKEHKDRTGGCLCGAVRYTAKDLEPHLGACHCRMCARWTGGPLFSVSAKHVVWEGEDAIQIYTSSDFAERAFCKLCGSALFYRVTAPGEYQGELQLSFGTLDDGHDFDLNIEVFVDRKPDAYALEGDRKRMTEADVMAMFESDPD